MKPGFTIATYNIQFSKRKNRIVENILQMAQDGVSLFCLQEILHASPGPHIVPLLLKRLGSSWRSHVYIGKEKNYLAHGTGLIWDSRIYRLKDMYTVDLPKMKQLPFHDQLIERSFDFLGVPIQRRVVGVTFQCFGKTIRVNSVHLDAMGGSNNRLKQLRYLLDLLRQKKPVMYELICGDFNTVDLIPTGGEIRRMRSLFKKYGFRDTTEPIRWTADLLNIDAEKTNVLRRLIRMFNLHLYKKLDFIWVRGFRSVEVRRENVLGSDHYPLITKLRFHP